MSDINYNDLMMAVLSMDAYLDFPNQNLGSARYITQKFDASTGFFAVAYNCDGGTVISYRGTDGAYIGDAF
jgi:hypothetical protein